MKKYTFKENFLFGGMVFLLTLSTTFAITAIWAWDLISIKLLLSSLLLTGIWIAIIAGQDDLTER